MSDANAAGENSGTESTPTPPPEFGVPGQTEQGSFQVPDGFILMSQDELNSKLAGNKKDLRQRLQQAETRAAAYDQLQGQVATFLDGGLEGVEVESLDDFRDAAAATLSQFRTDQERMADEQAKTAKALDVATQRAEAAESKFTTSTINQAITDEAVDKAYSAGALKLIKQHLRQYAVLQKDDSVVFTMNVADEEGNVSEKALTAKQAIEAMEADVDNFGPLFKSGVNGGTGENGNGKVSKGKVVNRDGSINVSMEEFMQMDDPNHLAEMVAHSVRK